MRGNYFYRCLVLCVSMFLVLMGNSTFAQKIKGGWYNCPSSGIAQANSEPRLGNDGVLRCIYYGGNLRGPVDRVVHSKKGELFTACLADNTNYLQKNGYSSRAFCTTNTNGIELSRSAYTWSGDKNLWNNHQIVHYGSVNPSENYKFTPCRVRIDKAYYFGYLLPQGGTTKCMFIFNNGQVLPSGNYYDLLILTKDYGVPRSGNINNKQYDAFELFNYPGMRPADRQILCEALHHYGVYPGKAGHIRLPGILLNGKCLSHWNGQVIVHSQSYLNKIGLR